MSGISDGNISDKNAMLDKMINGLSAETTGKFGTGFLTTHLLSRIVEISGVFVSESDIS